MRKKKPTKIELIKHKFYYDDDGRIKIENYGVYTQGLSCKEIKDYLRARADKIGITKLYKKFNEIAGVNTMSMYSCSSCDFNTSLMYRFDVERYADVLFGVTKSTFFD